jgi:hypothetical protein
MLERASGHQGAFGLTVAFKVAAFGITSDAGSVTTAGGGDDTV